MYYQFFWKFPKYYIGVLNGAENLLTLSATVLEMSIPALKDCFRQTNFTTIVRYL